MTIRRVKIILNPHAGMDSAKSKAEPLRPLVEELGGADWVETTQPRQAIELTRQGAEVYSQLSACSVKLLRVATALPTR